MGYLYILQSGNYLKIGISKNHPRQRVKQLQTGSAQEIKLLKFYKRRNYKELEKYLHYKFKRRRIRGEWFDIELQDITKEVEKENTMLQNIIDFFAWLWTMALGVFIIFMVILIVDGLFFGGTIISKLLDLFYY